MPSVSKTLGPLHFEDLEPKRFEDLTRQLIYDFRTWRRLEATGRSGSDDGFDARGYEIVGADPISSDEDPDDVAPYEALDRLWLVQCKRERTITPKKLTDYLDDIRLTDSEKLHGIVFAAACDFSKTARDKFSQKCRALGLKEWHLWGKAELEDKLMRPENDGLLFAYFGVSLTIRRRSQKSDLRARLTTKRKVHRLLGSKEHTFLLIRSPEAVTYPNPELAVDFKKYPPWLVRKYAGMYYSGIMFLVKRYFAYISDDGKNWDAALAVNDALPSDYEDPWSLGASSKDVALRQEIHAEWDRLPSENKAWLEVLGVIPFENILDVDELGDEVFEEAHVHIAFDPESGPFTGFYSKVNPSSSYDRRKIDVDSDDEGRIKKFSEEFRSRPKN